MDALSGWNYSMRILKQIVCGDCKGTRSAPDSSPSLWAEWGGRGFSISHFGLKKVCTKWEGAGHFTRDPCVKWNGAGVIADEYVDDEIKIPKGVKEGQKLRFTNKGHASEVYNAKPGDLIAKIMIKEHETFKRDGYNIISEVPITVTQAILGSKVTLETVHGEKEVEISGGVHNNLRYVLKNYGAPSIDPLDEKFGDHIIKFKIIIPTDLSERQLELIKKLKIIEESQGIKSGDMERWAKINKELDYQVVGGTQSGFWDNSKYKSGDGMDNQQQSIFSRMKKMIFG